MEKLLSDKYGIEKWEPIKSILGIRVRRDEEKGIMELDQEIFANNIVKNVYW